MNRTIFSLLSIAVTAFTTPCYADFSTTDNWKIECVGQYQISLPGEVEIAMKKLSQDGFSPDASYLDGNVSQFANMKYFGHLNVIAPASELDFIIFKNIRSANRDKTKKQWLSSSADSDQKSASAINQLTFDTPTIFGWDGDDYMPSLHFFLDGKIFTHSLTNYELDDLKRRALNKIHFNNFKANFRLRSIYEIPKQQGVCIPYGFIADDGTTSRNIAVTMRLLNHPDIEIGFRDNSYGEPLYETGKKIQYIHPEPKKTINDFWSSSGIVDSDEKVKASLLGMHSVEMDGRSGGAISVTITRADGSLDYGYVAAVQGDLKAKPDTPSLFLYVIRTASRAKGKPVSKDELKVMAEKIVASVKRHPVQ